MVPCREASLGVQPEAPVAGATLASRHVLEGRVDAGPEGPALVISGWRESNHSPYLYKGTSHMEC